MQLARTSKRKDLIETTLGQHLALSVAAHLARTQLVRDPFNTYEGEHLLQSLDVVANALLRVTPVYARGVGKGEPRQLTETELQGARVKNAAQNLLLSDGRNLSAVTVKRSELRQAIGILKAIGVPELVVRTDTKEAERSDRLPPDDTVRRRAQISEMEELLSSPLSPARAERANRIAIDIARSAPHGRIANLAMRLMSAIHEARNGGDEQGLRIMLARLSSALDEIARSRQPGG